MTAWQPLRRPYALPEGEVHVWRASLPACASALPALRYLLSAAERARADRFHFEVDRTRHTIGRALTRLLLGRCLGVAARSLTFEYSRLDKPMLPGSSPLRFNVSHSGDIVLVALARGRELGVDVERIRPDFATMEVADRYFSVGECRELASLAGEGRSNAFFACWSRKEAYIKARGDGLTLPLDQFDVAFLPGATPRLIATRHDPPDVARWSLRDLDVGPGYRGALVAEGSDLRLALWDWRGETELG
jgi:4'-phosphopantetheinyl transferase